MSPGPTGVGASFHIRSSIAWRVSLSTDGFFGLHDKSVEWHFFTSYNNTLGPDVALLKRPAARYPLHPLGSLGPCGTP
jgi:hypothetical protein